MTGYSPFASERVRGRLEIPKESIYFFRHGAEPNPLNGPSYHLYCSVKSLHDVNPLCFLPLAVYRADFPFFQGVDTYKAAIAEDHIARTRLEHSPNGYYAPRFCYYGDPLL